VSNHGLEPSLFRAFANPHAVQKETTDCHGLNRLPRMISARNSRLSVFSSRRNADQTARLGNAGAPAGRMPGCPVGCLPRCPAARRATATQRRSPGVASRRAIAARAGSAQRAPTGEIIAYRNQSGHGMPCPDTDTPTPTPTIIAYRVISGGYTSFAAGAARATGCLPTLPVPSLAREPGKAGCMSHRGRFFGKPLRTISRFRHQDAQTPPSPLVGEGGRGDEGQRCTGMQNIAHLSQKLYT